MGLPSVPVATAKLAGTTGRAMARAQGIPDFPIATVDYRYGAISGIASKEEAKRMAQEAFPQVKEILTKGNKEISSRERTEAGRAIEVSK